MTTAGQAVSGATRLAEDEEADRIFVGWYVYFVIGTAIVAGLALADSESPWPHRLAAAALVILITVLYLLVARPRQAGLRTDGPRAWIYVATASVLFAGAASMNSWAGVALFVLGPQLFLLLTFVPALVVLVALDIVSQITGAWSGGSSQSQLSALVMSAGVLAMSAYVGRRTVAMANESSARAGLIDELRSNQEVIARLSAERGAAAERERIARDVHDTLAQGFTSVVALGHAVQLELDRDPESARRHVQLMVTTAQENLEESRRLVAALTPTQLDAASLPQAVGRVAAAVGEEAGMTVVVEVSGEAHRLPPATEVVALRLCQEALNNVRKHSGATRTTVLLDYSPAALTIDVADDGRGFDPEQRTGGFGLASMRARAEATGGTLSVRSAAGEGTRVVATLPLPGSPAGPPADAARPADVEPTEVQP